MRIGLAFLAGLAVAVMATAAISAEGTRVVGEVNAALDGFQKNEAFAAGNFGGNEAEARQHLRQAEQVAGQCNTSLRLLIRDSREREVVAAQKKLEGFSGYISSVKKALAGAGQASEQLNQMAFAFIQEYFQDGTVSLAGPFIVMMLDPNSSATMGDDAARMKQLLARLETIDSGCKTKYRPIVNTKHPNGDRNLDPSMWCLMAANRQQMAQKSARNLATGGLNFWVQELNRMKAGLESREGFLQTDMAPVRQAIWDRAALRKDLEERYKGQFELVGITDTSNFFEPLEPAISALMEEVNRLAPQWKFPAPGPHDPGVEAMARTQVAKAYAGAAVRATVMKSATFHITKNRLGIPLERYKDGFVLYRMGNEKLCRQQSFTYTEVFDGAGARGYQRATGVRLNYIRYQTCP